MTWLGGGTGAKSLVVSTVVADLLIKYAGEID